MKYFPKNNHKESLDLRKEFHMDQSYYNFSPQVKEGKNEQGSGIRNIIEIRIRLNT